MHVYTIIITLLVIGSLFFDLKNNRGNIYFVGVLIFIGVITGLRSENVGHDTANYISIYDAVTCLPFKQIFTTAPYNALEPGYLAFCWISGAIGLSSDSFILLTSIVCFGCIGYWIWDNSNTPLFSLLIFFCMFYTFFLTGIRQSIALSIVLLSYSAIRHSKWKLLIIYVVIGFLFHRTSLIFLLMYAVSKVNNTRKALIISLLAFPIIYAIRVSVFPLLTLVSDRFENYEILHHGDATHYTILLAIVLVAAYFCGSGAANNSKDYKRNHVCLMVSFLIMPFVGLNGSIMRVAMYFTMAICFLVPQAIDNLSDKATASIGKIITICVLLYLVTSTLLSSEIYQFEFNPNIL